MKAIIKIHILPDDNMPLCRFSLRPYSGWPSGNIWVRPDEYDINVEACKNPEHELHAIFTHVMCEECSRYMIVDRPDDPPIIPREGRTCDHCGYILVPNAPAVYCCNVCALADVPELVALLPTMPDVLVRTPHDVLAQEAADWDSGRLTPAGWQDAPEAIPRMHVTEMSFDDLDKRLSKLLKEDGAKTTKAYERLTAEETTRVFAHAKGPVCPDCGFDLVEGPHGGLSVNWYCESTCCGSRFNFLGPRAELGIERITDAMPRVIDLAFD